MAWYYGTFSCGHDGRVDIIGPTKDREWKAKKKFDGYCPECYEKYRKEEKERIYQESVKKACEMELPELTGSEKQVAWANTLRMSFIDIINKFLDDKDLDAKIRLEYDYPNTASYFSTKEEILEAVDAACKLHTDSKFWIDNRFEKSKMLNLILSELRQHCNDIPEEVYQEIHSEKERLTVRPSVAKKDGVVVLEESVDGSLSAAYVKDDAFRQIVKEKHYTWNGQTWNRKINEFSGSMKDRAAELGNALLTNGFTVCFYDEESKKAAIAGDYEPECRQWIKRNKDHKSLIILWEGRNDTLYNAAKKLPGSKWADGGMIIPVSFYKEVEDFADTMNFKFSKMASSLIHSYMEKEKCFEKATVKEAVHKVMTGEDKLKKMLTANNTIIEDLKDDTE